MPLQIKYDIASTSAVLTAEQDVSDGAWVRVKQIATSVDAAATVQGRVLQMSWYAFLACVRDLAAIRRSFGVDLAVTGAASAMMEEYASDVRAVRDMAIDPIVGLGNDDIEQRLRARGFSKRTLTQYQFESVSRLAAMRNGANFSVPGAGKTTVALAVNELTRADSTVLLVVAPKNAFSAWDEAISDCYEVGADAPFVRLVGGVEAIRQMLRSGSHRLIISYDQLSVVLPIVQTFMATHPVHLVLDESHRIKAGEGSQRGASALRLASLSKRRDILSGTPAPNTIEDIKPQVDFLWPGLKVGNKVSAASNPGSILKPYYVRVTKDQLGLPPVTRRFIKVDMSEPQLALYAVLRNATIRRISMMRDGSGDVTAARSSALRLLQVSANPVAAVRAIENGSDLGVSEDALQPIYQAVLSAGVSPKMMEAERLVRETSELGRKTVLWTVFRRTIDDLEAVLSDMSPAVIHGGIGAGDVDDLSTREGRIKRFHDDDTCRVLIANPAACSEGISLHQVCHDAVYLDRTYNAAQYLQSVDRIHRLGLSPDVVTNVTILQSRGVQGIGSVDLSVGRRMKIKLQAMNALLEDEDLKRLALDEEEAETADDALDGSTTLDDLYDLVELLLSDALVQDGDMA